MAESESGTLSNLQKAQNIIFAHFGRAFWDAAHGEGDYSEFKDRTVVELYNAVIRDMKVIEEDD